MLSREMRADRSPFSLLAAAAFALASGTSCHTSPETPEMSGRPEEVCSDAPSEPELHYDAIGRVVMAPSEVPAGAVMAILGGPYLVWVLRQRSVA